LIRNSGYEGDIDFRPPYGKKLIGLPYYLQKQNKETIMWNLEPDTYFTTAAEKADYVMKNMKPGSIILMHPMYNQTELQAVEEILKRLTNEGYTFITVDELQEL
jgi:peptidoglycan/xylan/chitin deacetylase (PgdA/CDA1 family)